jgi:hypothetical protein
MSKPRRPKYKAPGKPFTAAPPMQASTPATHPAEPETPPAEILAEMAALAPEPATAEPHDLVQETVHAQEAVSEAVSDVTAAAFEAAETVTEAAFSIAPPVSSATAEGDEAPVPASTAITVPTLVGAVTPPSVPRITAIQFGAESIGTTMMSYVIGEGEAFAAHMRALAGARTMADFVRLQIGEFQRAADATLTCWGRLTVSASRTAVAR